MRKADLVSGNDSGFQITNHCERGLYKTPITRWSLAILDVTFWCRSFPDGFTGLGFLKMSDVSYGITTDMAVRNHSVNKNRDYLNPYRFLKESGETSQYILLPDFPSVMGLRTAWSSRIGLER